LEILDSNKVKWFWKRQVLIILFNAIYNLNYEWSFIIKLLVNEGDESFALTSPEVNHYHFDYDAFIIPGFITERE